MTAAEDERVRFCIQLGVGAAAQPLQQRLLEWAQASPLAARSWVDIGAEDGGYWNLQFETADAVACWHALRPLLGPAEHLIVTCEGRRGWQDYLLLHHHEPGEPCEDIAARLARPRRARQAFGRARFDGAGPARDANR